ncbi:MAG: hypothetical protein KJ970_15745 [Candidatus Eisenbacteria bacterium]|uniref:DUF6438 domain-containing protein n=1 Tax=Eiseniibacteriota bacterium TaxID=2212470 RepID=A0A948RXN1_UNCEI|nr:hypothetical protein [Candidatus Eisenbacteria bacterium]MBU1949111.1 hypothetical protein [Candidatus Eisenbacteria bacterium]MBU2692376.1 hypothetical protein [Candidatus Eisenbacteria bacterium]
MHRLKKLRIQRTPSLGSSPVYEAEIKDSGEVHYHGIDFVEKRGKHRWLVSYGQLALMAHALHKAGYLEMDDRYDALIDDCPSCITSVEFSNGASKTITHLYSEESTFEPLYQLERTIEKISEISKYIGE